MKRIILLLMLFPVLALGARTQYFDAANYNFNNFGLISAQELYYLQGATSNLQTQINGLVSNTAYNATSWNGVSAIAPSKDAVRDQIETMLTSISGTVSDTAYNAGTWDAVTTVAPSKNAVRDQVETMLTSISATVSDTAYNAGTWDGVTTIAPSKNAVRDQVELKANLASPALTGTPTAPTASASNNSTQIATTAYVDTADALKANLASPALTGTPTAPTAAAATNTTQIATTAFTTGAISTESALTVHRAGTETITGDKLITGQLTTTSTTKGNRPCPVMTDAQMLAIGSPSNGDCVTNSTKKAPYYYESVAGVWKIMGGGAGGSRLQLLTDSSFEDGVAGDGSCTTCVASQESSIVMATPNNTKSLKMAFTASTGNYTVDKTTGSEFTNSEAIVSCWIKNSNAGISFTARKDGADTTQTIAVLTDGQWHQYEIPTTASATSIGYKVSAASSITGSVYVDECYVGTSADLRSNSTAITVWTAFTPTGAFTTNTTYTGKYRLVGQNLQAQYKISFAGAANAVNGTVNLPSGFTMTSGPLLEASTNNIGPNMGIGLFSNVADRTNAVVVNGRWLTSSSIELWYMGVSTQVRNLGQVSNTAPKTIASGDFIIFNIDVPVTEATASVNSYTQKCQSDFECENVFSAKISTGGTVTAENVTGWLTSCTSGTATACTFKSGLFTVAPNCWVISNAGANQYIDLDGYASTSTVTFAEQNLAAGALDQNGTLYCQKTGVDYKVRREIVGTFKDVPNTYGTSGVDIQYVFFGTGASCASSCTTGTCTICKQVGNKITSVTWSSTGNYRVNGIDGTKYYCFGSAAGTNYSSIIYDLSSSTSSYAAVVAGSGASGGNVGFGSVYCIGVP